MLFKGYIETKGKKSIEKIKDRSNFKTYDEIKNCESYAGILSDNVILIDIDDNEQSEILMDIVEDLQLDCRIYKTTRGRHFLFQNTQWDKCGTNKKLACGLTADIKVGGKNTYEVLKIDGEERFIEYDSEEYEEIPKWLLPVSSCPDFINLKDGDGRNQTLFNYILILQDNLFEKEEIKECLRLINDYILKEPLSDNELKTILRDESFKKPVFFLKNKFLHNKFAIYLRNKYQIINVNNRLHIYTDGIYSGNPREIERAMINEIPCLKSNQRREVLDYLNISKGDEVQESPAKYIAFRNGILDITTDELLPYSPDFIITNKIPWNYSPTAYNELTDRTLDDLACGNFNIRLLLEEMIGYCLYRRNEFGKAFILTGTGSNGKSTMLTMIGEMLGENNVSALALDQLGEKFSTIMLFGKLANLGDDIPDEYIPNSAQFKKIVTGERINAQQKGQPMFDFVPHVKLLFSANNIPRIGKGKDTKALIRRLIIVPFKAEFTKEAKGENFKPFIIDDLKTESSMEYMINVGLYGLKRVLKNRNFTISKLVTQEIIEFEYANNPFLWFADSIEKSDIENQVTNDVYRKYTIFCAQNGLNPLSFEQFKREVRKKYNFSTPQRRVNGKKYRVFVSNEA